MIILVVFKFGGLVIFGMKNVVGVKEVSGLDKDKEVKGQDG